MYKRKKALSFLFIFMALSSLSCAIEETPISKKTQGKLQSLPSSALFTPPKGWRFGDQKSLGQHVQIMVIGKGKNTYPPSINLATEKFTGTLKDYLKIVKKINDSEKIIWKDLGPIRTQAGNVNLSQIEMQTEWGQVKMMHAIIVRDQTAYIMTAAALKDEFPDYYKDFFSSIQSLRINKDLYETVKDSKERVKLKKINEDLENQFDLLLKENYPSTPREIFESSRFQNGNWKPFQAKIKNEYSYMEEDWQNLIFSTIQSILINSERNEK